MAHSKQILADYPPIAALRGAEQRGSVRLAPHWLSPSNQSPGAIARVDTWHRNCGLCKRILSTWPLPKRSCTCPLPCRHRDHQPVHNLRKPKLSYGKHYTRIRNTHYLVLKDKTLKRARTEMVRPHGSIRSTKTHLADPRPTLCPHSAACSGDLWRAIAV